MDDRKAYKDLMKKKIGVLRKMAEDFKPPIEIKPTWTRARLSKLILARRFVPVSEQIKDKYRDPKERQEQQPIKPGFEQAVAEPPEEKRGGAREGAGRTPGLTAEKAKVKNLPQYPSNPIKQGSQALFDLWASAAKIEQLALSEDEADLLSLPVTQLAEYYFPGMIPEIAGTWVMMIFAVTRIMKPRIKLIEEIRKLRRAEHTKDKAQEIKAALESNPVKGGNGKLYHYCDNRKPIHAIAPGEAAHFTNNIATCNCEQCRDILKNRGESITEFRADGQS